jgi:V8-like Glu-specific endopeptidase
MRGAAAVALTLLLSAVPPAWAWDVPRLESAGGGATVPVAVFGSDDRVNVPARLEWIAQRIGILFNNQARTVCTAFCVADNVIATAAHCFSKGQSSINARYADFAFVRNYDRSKAMVRLEGATSGSAAQHVTTGDFRLRVRPPIDAAHDWALARLPRNSCPADGLKVQVMSSDDLIAAANAKMVFQVSYHRDWAQWRPAYSKPCTVARDFDQAKWSSISPDFMKPEQMVLHTCDTGGASSGSPLLIETADGAAVVAINVGTYVQSKTASGGTAPARPRTETIANTAVNSSAFAERIELMRSAPILTSGPQLRDLQDALRALGHYNGRSDGAFGPAMKTAIEAFEGAVKLPVNGLPTRALMERVLAEPQRGVAPASAPAPPLPVGVPQR